MIKLFPLKVAILCFPQVLLAEATPTNSDEGRFTAVRGIGATSCDDFLKFEKFEKMQDAVVGWTYGYWSGLNLAINVDETKLSTEKNLFDQSVEPDALLSRVKARCIEDSTKNVMDVISEIYWELAQ